MSEIRAIDSLPPDHIYTFRDQGNCSLCGSNHRGGTDPYVDLNLHIDYEGHVVICIECARLVGEAVGCASPRKTTRLQNKVQRLDEERQALIDELEILSPIKSALVDAL